MQPLAHLSGNAGNTSVFCVTRRTSPVSASTSSTTRRVGRATRRTRPFGASPSWLVYAHLWSTNGFHYPRIGSVATLPVPGTSNGPIRTGQSHFESSATEGPVVTIRAPTASVLVANGDRQVWVTRCNSGSARHHGGLPVPRGPSTFQLPETAGFRPVETIEVSYKGEALLPRDTEWAPSLHGPWKPLCGRW